MYHQNETRFNGVYFRDNLPDKIKDGAYVNDLDECSDIEIHWIALYVNSKTITYFDSFGVEHIRKEFRKCIERSTLSTIYFIHVHNYNKYFSEYKDMIQQRVDIFVLDLLILCLKAIP